MLAGNEVTAMIAVTDLARARKFYEDVLGLKPASPDDSEVQVYQSGNAKIAIYVSEFAGTNRATAITWEVPDLEAEVKDLKAKGVRFEHYDMPNTTRKADIHVSGPIQNSWFKDPDGNIIAVMKQVDVTQARQSDRAASAGSNR
ncbi:MAG: VOC family protein [Gemmatimonadota bacterium]